MKTLIGKKLKQNICLLKYVLDANVKYTNTTTDFQSGLKKAKEEIAIVVLPNVSHRAHRLNAMCASHGYLKQVSCHIGAHLIQHILECVTDVYKGNHVQSASWNCMSGSSRRKNGHMLLGKASKGNAKVV